MSAERSPLPRRAIEVLREEGVPSLWWRSLALTAYRRLVVVARNVDDGPPSGPRRLRLSFDYLQPDSVDEYVQLRRGADPREIKRRLEIGQRCLLVRHRGEVVSARWIATGRAEMPYLDHVFDLPEGVAYVYDVYTSPRLRRQGISGDTRHGYESELRRSGARRLLGTFMPQSAAGRGLVTGAGYTPVGTIGCLRLLGLRLLFPRIPPGYLGAGRRLRT